MLQPKITLSSTGRAAGSLPKLIQKFQQGPIIIDNEDLSSKSLSHQQLEPPKTPSTKCGRSSTRTQCLDTQRWLAAWENLAADWTTNQRQQSFQRHLSTLSTFVKLCGTRMSDSKGLVVDVQQEQVFDVDQTHHRIPRGQTSKSGTNTLPLTTYHYLLRALLLNLYSAKGKRELKQWVY